MAERRMMSKKVIDTDAFMDLPMTAQCLYMHFMMQADDDGFLCNAKRVMRSVGGRQEDIDALVKSGFMIAFRSGVMVVTHWNVHNLLRKDRYQKTSCSEIELVTVDKNNVYILVAGVSECDENNGNQVATDGQPNGNQVATVDNIKDELSNDSASEGVATKWQPSGNQVAPQVRLGKDRLYTTTTTIAHARAREAYENNIHPVASEIEMQKIDDDCQKYGEDIFVKAIERAVLRGNRSLGYIEGILKRWETHGYDDGGSRAGNGNGKAGKGQVTRGEEWRDVPSGWGPIEK